MIAALEAFRRSKSRICLMQGSPPVAHDWPAPTEPEVTGWMWLRADGLEAWAQDERGWSEGRDQTPTLPTPTTLMVLAIVWADLGRGRSVAHFLALVLPA